MKKFAKVISLLMIVLLVVSLCACGEEAPADPNCGLYVAKTAGKDGLNVSVTKVYPEGMSIELKAKNRCTITISDQSASGKWSLDGDVFHCEGGGVYFDGTLSEGKIVIENIQDSGLTMTFVNENYGQ